MRTSKKNKANRTNRTKVSTAPQPKLSVLQLLKKQSDWLKELSETLPIDHPIQDNLHNARSNLWTAAGKLIEEEETNAITARRPE